MIMSEIWINTSAAKRAISYLADSRPVWLYSSISGKLLWRNLAACLCNAKLEKESIKLAPPPFSLKAQVKHILKLTPFRRTSLIGRSSLARIRFGSNKTQFFLTCQVTPLKGDKKEDFLLIVGVDEIEPSIFEKYSNNENVVENLFGKNLFDKNLGFIILDKKKQATVGTRAELESFKLGEVDLKNPNENILRFLLNDEKQTAFVFLDIKKKKTLKKKTKNNLSATKGDEVILWQVTGKGIEIENEEKVAEVKNKDNKTSYNFEELSRILRDKTSREKDEIIDAKNNITKKIIDFPSGEKSDGSSLVNISQETLVLNRLPIGLVIFRDQKIVFANRQILKITDYENLEDFKKAGLSSLFPTAKETKNEPAGPITHLVKKDGTQVLVSARLQVITWQGKSAFLLSAKEENNISNFENTKFKLREFMLNFAKIEDSGFISTDRSGTIVSVNDKVSNLLNIKKDALISHSLSKIIKPNNISKFRFFLERDAKSAQTEVPSILLETNNPELEVLLFAEGQAGIVQSYFGLLREIKISPQMYKKHFAGIDPKTLTTISRSMRRPLNSIIGFSELISAQSLESDKYKEYANDIKIAGYELTNVVGDLEAITKLKNVETKPISNDFDLSLLLEKSIFRTRHLALKKQVLIRSSVSDKLGNIQADKASLEQAILNLIASAIEQTSRGEQVIITASQIEDDMIGVHVRNSGLFDYESENFVVFRDGIDENGERMEPVESSVGLSLTRSLLAVNSCTLELDPTGTEGTLFSLEIPASLKIKNNS